jgi:hypothetical protein
VNEAVLGEGPLDDVGDERDQGDKREDGHGRDEKKLTKERFEVLVRELELRPERVGVGWSCGARTAIRSRRKFLAVAAGAAEGADSTVEKGHDEGDDVVHEQIGEHEQLRSTSTANEADSEEGRERMREKSGVREASNDRSEGASHHLLHSGRSRLGANSTSNAANGPRAWVRSNNHQSKKHCSCLKQVDRGTKVRKDGREGGREGRRGRAGG